MFTGIIEGLGEVLALTFFGGQAKLRIKPLFAIQDYQLGESIAINGACLTVEEFSADWFEVYASAETLRLTNLQKLVVGSVVNLERALAVGGRLGGHFVNGHIDTLATVQSIHTAGESRIFHLTFKQEFSEFLVSKGSITLDGISLTVNNCGTSFLEINIIPKTLAMTNISNWQIGYTANMETDLLGKYAVKKPANLTLEFLQQYGF